jgi:membrane protease YdiL (CAAX protease family)
MSSSENTAENGIELMCTGCGERNPPRFAFCWNCGQSLEDAERVESTEPADAVEEKTLSWRSISKYLADHRTDWCELVAVLLATFVYHVLATSLTGSNTTLTAQLVAISRYIGWSILLWILIRRDARVPQPVALRESRWLYELGFAVLIVGANWLVSCFAAVLAHDMRLAVGTPPVSVEVVGLRPWFALGTAMFFGATYEELLYRVYLQSKLESLLGDTILSIVISAMIFAANHGYPPAATLRVFAVGVLYGTIYYFSRRLPRLVLGHWMHNVLVTIVNQY